jgi:excisionase family DNA binding protein
LKKPNNKSQGDGLNNFITIGEAAELRGVTRSAIHELVQRGRLHSQKMFGRILLLRSEVLAFEREKPGPKAGDH